MASSGRWSRRGGRVPWWGLVLAAALAGGFGPAASVGGPARPLQAAPSDPPDGGDILLEDFDAAGNPYEDRAFALASPGNGRGVWNGNIDGVPVAGAPEGSLQAAFGQATREVTYTPSVTWVSPPWYTQNTHAQSLYSAAVLGGTPRTISGIQWRLRPGNTLATGTYQGLKVKFGHNVSGSLSADFTGSFSDPPATSFDADYVLTAGMEDQGWVEGPAFSADWNYNGVDGLVLDIEVPGAGGPYNQMPLDTTGNAGTEYQHVGGAGAGSFQGKNLEMRFLHLVDACEAQSKWYDSGADHPSYLDPVVEETVPAGTAVTLTWQGGMSDPGDPGQVDPLSLSAWTTSPFPDLYGYRFLRWHAAMQSDAVSAAKPRVDSIRVPFIPFDSPANVPVLLVHGNPGSPGSFGPDREGLPMLGALLRDRGHVVPPPYDASSVAPADWRIRELAGRLHADIQDALAAASGPGPVPLQVDVVAHGTGGLVARAYMAGLAVDGEGAGIPYPGTVRRLVAVGAPHYGAARGGIARSIVPVDGIADFRGDEIRTCGPFLWGLHDAWTAAAGAGDLHTGDVLCVVGVLPGDDDDNAVLMSSAALPSEDPPGADVRYLPYRHSEASPPKDVPSLAFVTSAEHGLPGIVADFLEGRTVRTVLDLPAERERSTLVLVRAEGAAGKATPRSIRVDGKRYGRKFKDGETGSAAFLVRMRSGSDGDHVLQVRLPGNYVQPPAVGIGPLEARPIVLTVEADPK